MKKDLDISVVIATHNRAEVLRESLMHLVRLDRSGVDVEFVVVDNNSSDSTQEVLAAFSGRLPLRYLFEPKPGQNCARNRALAEGGLGRVIAFTDDDIEPDENWLQVIKSVSHLNPDCSIFGGAIYPIWPAVSLPIWIRNDFIQQFGYAANSYSDSECFYEKNQYPTSGNFWIRRELMSNGRRFDESIAWHPKSRIMATETVFLQRLCQEGYKMFYTPDAVVGHKISPEQLTLRYLMKRAYSWGRGQAYLRPLCRGELLVRYPMFWRLIRIGAIFRLILSMALSIFPSVFRRPQNSIQAMQWIGYNVESMRIAKEHND